MVAEAQKFSDEDNKRKEKIEVLNQADTLLYSTEKSIIELGDKVKPEEREKIKVASEALKESDQEG